jgi:hypothetical protein
VSQNEDDDPYLAVLLGEFLVGADDVVEVRVHELGRDVDVVEGLRDRRRDHVSEANDLRVLQSVATVKRRLN